MLSFVSGSDFEIHTRERGKHMLETTRDVVRALEHYDDVWSINEGSGHPNPPCLAPRRRSISTRVSRRARGEEGAGKKNDVRRVDPDRNRYGALTVRILACARKEVRNDLFNASGIGGDLCQGKWRQIQATKFPLMQMHLRLP
ncbi:MAG: hypothetical protein ACRD1T_04515 [Acidimicrobiia bacterium]